MDHSLLPLCSRIIPEFVSVINLWVSRAIDHYRGCFSLWSNLKVIFCYIFYQVCCDDRSSVSKYQFSWIEGKNELLEHYCWSEYNTSDAASIYFQINTWYLCHMLCWFWSLKQARSITKTCVWRLSINQLVSTSWRDFILFPSYPKCYVFCLFRSCHTSPSRLCYYTSTWPSL